LEHFDLSISRKIFLYIPTRDHVSTKTSRNDDVTIRNVISVISKKCRRVRMDKDDADCVIM